MMTRPHSPGAHRPGPAVAALRAGPHLRIVLLAGLLGLLAAGSTRALESSTASTAFRQVADAFWSTQMELSPTWATYLGDHRFDDQLPRLGVYAHAIAHARYQGLLDRLRAIDPTALAEDERLSHEILENSLKLEIDARPHRLHEWKLDQMDGPQVWFLELTNYHPVASEADLVNLGRRYEKFPHYIQQYIADLSAGLDSGRVAPRLALDRVLGQLEAILATPPAKSPLAQVVDKIPENLDAATRGRLASDLIESIEKAVYPAYRDLQRFLTGYRSRARDEVGLWSIPGGTDAYRYLIRVHTSTAATPEEIHQIGRTELSQIRKEMRRVARRLGHTGDLGGFIRHVTADPANFATSREDVLARYEEAHKRAQEALPTMFSLLPSTPCIVKPIESYREKDSVAAFYYPAPEDGSRPGIYYANTYEPSARPLFNVMALTVHEAVPGHHLQIAIAQENHDLPQFRRQGGYTVFVEGWGLYAERLADEMGLYDDDRSRFGMLTYQAWRACRLVVDTGMHALRWTRQQALDFMTENLALSQAEIVNEIDRYIIWPGQALAYKLGQREFFRLRQKARQALGDRFDIREFHRVVLTNGAMPMNILERQVDRWVAEQDR